LLQLCIGSHCLWLQASWCPEQVSQRGRPHLCWSAYLQRLQQDCGIKISNWRDLQLIVSEVDDKYSHLYQNGYKSSLEKTGNVVL
jgi:hypothetical protein